MTEPRVEAGDRALETARKIVKITKYEIARCGKDIYDNTSRVYGCCRPEAHDGPHETLEDRHVGRYTQETENKQHSEVAELIQSAMNAQERELWAKIKPMLDNLHTKPQPETGAWWRGECESNCHACTIERLLAERGEGK